MKRGLVTLDPAEVPSGELEGRTQRLQQELRAEGVAAALLYGDVYRSGDLTYLSNLCIYWNEGVLTVPASGRSAMLTKLSARVHPWMRATSNVEDFRSGPRLERLVQAWADELDPGPIGLVEQPWWPAQLVDEIRRALAPREIRDLGPIVGRRRTSPSAPELRLLRAGARVTQSAIGEACSDGLSDRERAGVAEATARGAGVEDVTVRAQPCGDGASSVEIVSEYRGYWTGAARVVAAREPAWLARLRAAYGAAVESLGAGQDARAIADAASDALRRPCHVELLDHTELETGGDYRNRSEAHRQLAEPAVVHLRVELQVADGMHAVIADTYELSGGERRSLTCTAGPEDGG